MLKWSIVFLVIALISGLFGFGIVGSAALGFAKILFWLFVIIFIVSLVMGRRSV